MVPDVFVSDLLSRVDIVDIIDQYVGLKRVGSNFSACCPFHEEKTPSFTVSATKQFYHCFGCGVHGSAISFLMLYRGLSFVESVEELAKSVGLQVPYQSSSRADDSNSSRRLYDSLSTAVDAYVSSLSVSAEAMHYLTSRGLDKSLIELYRLGFAPNEWSYLRSRFAEYEQRDDLLQVGLVVCHEKNKRRYDRFRNRIIFPILDVRGQPIALGGRSIDGTEPKYLNSPETPLFSKGRVLYGLSQARQAIRKRDSVFVVEGYMDVVSLAQCGIDNCVATLGTACTAEHVRLLTKQSRNVYFCFDGDQAGQKAACRALQTALPYADDQTTFYFMLLPESEDPDSYVRKFGKDAFLSMSSKAMPLSFFMVQQLSSDVNLGVAEGRARLLSKAKPFLQKMPLSNLRNDISHQLAALVHLKQEDADRSLGLNKKQASRSVAYPLPSQRKVVSLASRLTELLFAKLPAWPLVEIPQDVVSYLKLEKQDLHLFLAAIDLCAKAAGSDALLADMVNAHPLGEELQRAQSAAVTIDWLDESAWRIEFEDGISQLRQRAIEVQMNEITMKLSLGQELLSEEKEKLVACVQALSSMKRARSEQNL